MAAEAETGASGSGGAGFSVVDGELRVLPLSTELGPGGSGSRARLGSLQTGQVHERDLQRTSATIMPRAMTVIVTTVRVACVRRQDVLSTQFLQQLYP